MDLAEIKRQNIEYTGKRIRCVEMNDIEPIESGTEGTVVKVDSIGTIHVQWDNGRTLGIIPKIDKFEFI